MLVAVTLLPFLVITVGAQQQPTTATEAFDFIVGKNYLRKVRGRDKFDIKYVNI